MPLLPVYIQDLISRMLTVDPSERITIKEIKEHPAFKMGLPDGYIIPAPLPIPSISDPIDFSKVPAALLDVLKAIGYRGDDEIKREFENSESSPAKLFYWMFFRLSSPVDLPWDIALTGPVEQEDSDPAALIDIEDSEDDFLMPPESVEIGTPSPGGHDEFFRKRRGAMVSPGGSFMQSLAKMADWSQIPDSDVKEEQPFVELRVPMVRLVLTMQRFFLKQDFQCFFTSDVSMIVRKSQSGLCLKAVFKFETLEYVEMILSFIDGKQADFEQCILDVQEVVEESVNLYQDEMDE